MAEMPRQLSQAEIDRILFNQSMGLDPRGQVPMPSVQNLQQRTSGTITPVAPNFAQLAAGGANRVGQFLNQILPNAQQVVAANPLNLERLFPTTAQPQLTIPTGFNFAPKQAPTGEVIPGGLQSQQVNMNQLLSAIKPADVLGVSGAERAYTDVGYGRMPQPMDVAETLALGAGGMAAGRGLLKAGKGLPVGMSIQETTGLLQTAPKSDIGFYSAVEQAAMASPRKSATGQAFLNDIMKGPDVRADEIKWMGLDDYLKGKQNVTKQEVQDYIANNRVDVQEVRSTIPRLPGEEMPGDKGAFLPKFGQYTLPGGENYRELLLTMPAKQKLPEGWEIKHFPQANQYALYNERGEQVTRRPTSEQLMEIASKNTGENYRSTHFPDQPNILAHLRVNDRVDADGKKMLLIEEVQSDWHQAGREKGYVGAESKAAESAFKQYSKELADKYDLNPEQNLAMYATMKRMQPDEVAKYEQLQSAWTASKGGVPDAPFKDTWYQLALKRAIQHAAENGYDRIGLTTGSQQAARFDLSKQVSEIRFDGSSLHAYDKNGNMVINQNNVTEDNLSDYIGKEATKKLLEQEPKYNVRKLSGIDLQFGGEGMKKYYDEIYPKFLDKYGKKWGARVGETKISIAGGKPTQYGDFDSYMKSKDNGTETIRYLDVTPEMKAGVSKGQPLFQAAPIIGTGLLGSQQEKR